MYALNILIDCVDQKKCNKKSIDPNELSCVILTRASLQVGDPFIDGVLGFCGEISWEVVSGGAEGVLADG